ncbi:MAG: virulence protein E [Bacteroidetes bacterium]|nr:MAG: virulence protein E [Bacteroidota bacterium]
MLENKDKEKVKTFLNNSQLRELMDTFDCSIKSIDYKGEKISKEELKAFIDNGSDSCPQFSYFKNPITNTHPYQEINLSQLYEVIHNPKYFKERTEKLRNIENEDGQQIYKRRNFDYVTFSGTFTYHNDRSLSAHTGYICLDFDEIDDCGDLKQRLLKDEEVETEMLFISPSGGGLKWIVQVDIQHSIEECKEDHLSYFEALEYHILDTYDIPIDKSGKNVSRACYIPHDPDVFINPKYLRNDTTRF